MQGSNIRSASRRTFLGLCFQSAAVALVAQKTKPQSQGFETPAVDVAGNWQFVPNPKLPNVLILGDSISIGYTRDVRALMHDEANIFRPMSSKLSPVNCGDTPAGLKGIDRWLGDTKWNVIHFNWGLWDLCYRNPESATQGHRDKVHGTLTSSIADYKANLEKLIAAMQRTGAKLIWASTTAVPPNEAGRFVGDDAKYNAAAAEVMRAHNIPTDDLYALTKTFPPDEFQEPGNVHYTAAGYKRIAEQVASSIRKQLRS